MTTKSPYSRENLRRLERLTREAIHAAYHAAQSPSHKHDDRTALRDYVENYSMRDEWTRLLDAEASEERRHRNGWNMTGRRVMMPIKRAALILILHNIGRGARSRNTTAADFLIYRVTAVTAQVIGQIAHAELAPIAEELEALDYAAAVKDAA